jgi:hypothetical protein
MVHCPKRSSPMKWTPSGLNLSVCASYPEGTGRSRYPRSIREAGFMSFKRMLKQATLDTLLGRTSILSGIEMGLEKARNKSEPITFESENYQETDVGFFEDNGTTGYLYILDAKTRNTIAACWLYNRIPAPTLAEALKFAERDEAPPLPSDYDADDFHPRREDLSLSLIRVLWNELGTATILEYQGKALGMMAKVGGSWKSYPFLLNESCKWGEPLTRELVYQHFPSLAPKPV